MNSYNLLGITNRGITNGLPWRINGGLIGLIFRVFEDFLFRSDSF